MPDRVRSAKIPHNQRFIQNTRHKKSRTVDTGGFNDCLPYKLLGDNAVNLCSSRVKNNSSRIN